MAKISLRYKVSLELYASLSLIAAIILLYSSLSHLIDENIHFAAIAIIGIFLIGLILSLRNLILDVNSAKFDADESQDDPNIVEITGINKVTLELISSVSNVMIIAVIFIFGIGKSGGAYSELISMVFIIILLIPMIILIKSLIFDFNLIFMNKRHSENFINQIINRRTLVFFVIAIIIILSVLTSNKLVTSVAKLYDRSISAGEEAMDDLSSNIYITSIAGERNDISAVPIDRIYIYVEATAMDFNVKSISVKYMNETTTSTFNYGTIADESHFSYEGKISGKGNPILKTGDVGTLTINLSATKHELYPHKKAILQIIPGNDKIISKEIKAPEFRGEIRILLYTIN